MPERVKSILFLRPDKLGDMIATIPAIHALKREIPHIRIEVIASPRNKIVIENDPFIDAIHLYTKNIFHDYFMIIKLRRNKYDIVYDPICHDSVTGLLLTKIIGSESIKAASRKLNFQHFYDYCEPYQPDGDDHNIDNGLLICNVLGRNPDTINPFQPIFIPESAIKKAKEFCDSIQNINQLRIALNISAGSPTRTLPVERYSEIVKGIRKHYKETCFIIICTMGERERGIELFDNIAQSVYIVPEGLSLHEVTAIIRHVDILISPDTSLIHIARLMNIPVVGLYSGHLRNYRFWRPYRQECGSVIANNVHNLHDITAERVVEAFGQVVQKYFPSVKYSLRNS
jgi:ADP-heptose:LPS heptosyltransferase